MNREEFLQRYVLARVANGDPVQAKLTGVCRIGNLIYDAIKQANHEQSDLAKCVSDADTSAAVLES